MLGETRTSALNVMRSKDKVWARLKQPKRQDRAIVPSLFPPKKNRTQIELSYISLTSESALGVLSNFVEST